MRIVSGIYRGRRFQPPSGLPVRPTTDFAKEGLFNLLVNMVDFERLKVLDLFSGTGGIALEFVSRGAERVTVVDSNPRCVDFIRKCADEIGVENLKAVRSDAFRFLKHDFSVYDLVFADPPYDLEGIDGLPDIVMATSLIDIEGLFILEHSDRYNFGEHPDFLRNRKYGSVNFTFFRKAERNPG